MNVISENVRKDSVNTRVMSSGNDAMQTFHSQAHFWGRFTLWLLIAVCFIPPLYLSIVLDAHPGWNAILTGLAGYASFVGVFWVLEPITYYATLGVGGTYLAFLTGNIANMCLPCSSAAQKAINAEPGSRKAEIAGVFGIAVASITNIVVIVISILGGTYILSLIPPAVESAFTFITPAIFGSVLGQFAYKNPLYGAIAIGVGMLVFYSPLPSFIKIAVSVVIVITVILFMEKQKEKRADV